MGKWWSYSLVNVHITDGKIAMLLIGKSSISMVIFNSYVILPEGKLSISLVGGFWNLWIIFHLIPYTGNRRNGIHGY